MLRNPDFWKHEGDAPLLTKNRGFINRDSTDQLLERAAKWPSLLPLDSAPAPKVPFEKYSIEGEPDRVVIKDAERTFFGDEHRKHLIRVLSYLRSEFGDYAQGASYVTSFLMLFLDVDVVVKIMLLLNQNQRYLPGYWKAEAVAFATDAFVFERMLSDFNPAVQKHLVEKFVFPNTYVQKWFVGLGIHVLPFEALFDFFEEFFASGYPFLFRFGLSLVDKVQEPLLKAKEAAKIFSLLRLDDRAEEDQSVAIVRDAKNFDLSKYSFDTLRPQLFNEKLKAQLDAAAKAMEAKKEEDDDDSEDEEEGEECGICTEMIPDFYCLTCKVLLCESCHEDSKKPHKKEHKVKPIDEVDVDALTKELGSLSVKA
eukprot:TRINITY_DN5041_c0_g1_i1.p1 TRINITY_DN5041_c0_g1~~TRINITY_DN5041_c0_g1_i1.p1  ORF type:complete len:368 (+),score=89.70 TRINITY_DN5041_c0_g1_i1:1302-2405(+)